MSEVAAVKSQASLQTDDAQPTDFVGRLSQKFRKFNNLSQWYLEKKYGRSIKEVESVDTENPEITFVEDPIIKMSFEEMTGMQRLRAIHFKEHGMEIVENKLTLRAMLAAGASGFFVSGVLGQSSVFERYESYASGKNFGNARNAMRRKMDYSILMFTKNGLRGGIRVGAVCGLGIFLTLNLSAYRNKYCSYYFPLALGTISALSMARGGSIGLFFGFGFGVLPGLALSASLIAYSWYNGKTANQGYWTLRKVLEDEIRYEKERRMKVKRLMLLENIPLEFLAEYRLREIEAEDAKRIAEGKLTIGIPD